MSPTLHDLAGEPCPACGVRLGMDDHNPACGFADTASVALQHETQRTYDICDKDDPGCQCHDCTRWRTWYYETADDTEYAIPQKSQAEPR